MKTKITLLRMLFTVLVCTLFSLTGRAQVSSVQFLVANDLQVAPNQYEFDVFLVSTGSSSFQLASSQYNFTYNNAARNGGAMTAAWVAGSTQLSNTAQLQNTINTAAAGIIRVAAPAAPGCGNGSTIATAPGTKIGRMRLTNSIPWATNAQLNVAFNLATSANPLCKVNFYDGTTCLNTGICIPNATVVGCVGSTTFQSTLTNPALNAPSCTAPVLSASTVAATCAGGNDGSIDLTITGGTPAPLSIVWSTGASTEDLSGLTAGTYTVTVSTDGGQCSATASYTVNDGAPSVTYYADADNDTYGNAAVSQVSCTGAPVGYVLDATDCDDNNATVNPGATEVCNLIDDDCDGSTDEGVQNSYYADGDNDTYGAGVAILACIQPVGTSTNNLDCDDNNAAINPGAAEVCNSIDDDCDGSTDEGLVFADYYADLDLDTYGGALLGNFCAAPVGSVTVGGDCDDNNAAVNPGATEVCNSIDDDCDGSTDEGVLNTYYADADNDTYGAGAAILACTQPVGTSTNNTDCDDNNAAVNPGATEVCNSIDDDCDGSTDEGLVFADYYADLDLDTYGGALLGNFCAAPVGSVAVGGDCNDNNAAINPGATEVCNTIDDDCDGTADDGLTFVTYYADADNDTYGNAASSVSTCNGAPVGYVADATDCDDNNAAINPGAAEVCNNIDDNCNGLTDDGLTFVTYYADADNDTYGNAASSVSTCNGAPVGYVAVAGDCDDNNAAINPGAAEVCNSIDDDCDGSTDEGLVFADYYADLDLDTYGGALLGNFCAAPVGSVTVGGDCDDNNAAVNPGAAEVCNNIDDNCNGLTDDGLTFVTYYADADNDTYGNAASSVSTCNGAPVGYVAVAGDCDDNNAAVNPGAAEVCNNIDDNCNGLTDDGLTFLTYYVDADGDGFGDASATGVSSCTPIFGSVTNNTDCNDASNSIFPGAPEQCNNIDDDCDGQTDEGVTVSTWYADADGDTYGNAAVSVTNCAQPVGYVLNSTDCDDNNAAVNPGALEVCNSIDDDCDGSTDEGVTSTFYADADGDTYGDASVSVQACSAPVGYVADATDCNDANAAVNPGATEVCNSIDDDCDGSTDEGVLSTFYADADGDTYGDASVTVQACSAPVGYVADATDCNDANAAVNPGATEVCNSIDDDCDGSTDEGVLNTYYADADADNYGNSAVTATGCSAPVGYVAVAGDCDDNNAAVNPGAAEVCNNIDDNCNGLTDDGLPTFTYYADVDADTYGDASNSVTTCATSLPVGYVSNSTDCDDNNAAVNPGATEICGNLIDDNCDGSIDEGCGCSNPPTSNAGANQTICAGQNVSLNGSIGGGATNGTWSNGGGDGTFSPSASVLNATYIPGPNDIANGSVTLTLTTDAPIFCSPATSSLTVTIQALPASPGAIAGPATLCNPNNIAITYSIAPVVGATSYTWTVPAGTTLISGQGTTSITVSWPFTNIHNGVVGNICVTANNSNSCGSGAPSCLGISVQLSTPVTPNSISGAAKACPGETVTYSVASVFRADTYTWSVPAGASIVSGQGTNIISVAYGAGFTGGPLTVYASNACGSSPVRSRNVSLNILAAPAAISGQSTGVCGASGVAYTTAGVVGATSYFWTVPVGASIASGQGTNSITVDFSGSFAGGPVTVLAQNGCGNGATRALTVSGAPGIAAPISGSTGLCALQNYLFSVPTIAGASTYTWTVPTGFVIQSGQGTKDLTVKAAANPNTNLSLSVRASNACGTGPIRTLSGISITLCPRIGEGGAMNILAYPNPVSDLLNISFDSDKNQDVLVTLTDAAGRVVLNENRNADEGANKFEVSVKGMASGIYTMMFRTNDSVQKIRVVVE
jgi:PKD-like domain/Secretion system C-terminal sorting domain/Putative metal-binding motif